MNTPTLPNTLYRFRSIDALLDKYQELENQTIYFASPDQLNDPMEGFRDIVWRGDRIVWTNLFKHYVYCLHASYFLFHMAGNYRELHVNDIPIEASWDQISTHQAQRLFDDIWHRFLCLPHMPNLIEALSNRNHRPIRYRELRSYLQTIHSVFLDEVVKSYVAHGIKSESNNASQSGEMSAHALLGLTLALILDLEEIETEEEYNVELRKHEALDTNHRIRHLQETEQWITQHYENPISAEMLRRNSQLVVPDFPAVYLNEIERLLWPNWYTACFMGHYHNSSVWGHYGDGHKGVCLIFETEIADGLHSFSLNEVKMTGNGTKTSITTKRPFREVRYAAKPGEVDFFRSIGRLTGDELKKQWYTDDEGNESKCGNHLQSDGATFNWQESYWDRFYRDITAKTKDWEYEQEYRLILEDISSGYNTEESRTITYVFSSLKGIMFGIKTSDEDKLRIRKIIQGRCQETNRKDFKFYQAYYSPETGDIRKYELPVDFS